MGSTKSVLAETKVCNIFCFSVVQSNIKAPGFITSKRSLNNITCTIPLFVLSLWQWYFKWLPIQFLLGFHIFQEIQFFLLEFLRNNTILTIRNLLLDLTIKMHYQLFNKLLQANPTTTAIKKLNKVPTNTYSVFFLPSSSASLLILKIDLLANKKPIASY